MSKSIMKIALLCVVACQLSQATPPNLPEHEEEANSPTVPSTLPPSNEQSTAPSTDANANPAPTDPLQLNKIAFEPLVPLWGNAGLVVYTLLTEKNALGDQMGVVSDVIVKHIGLPNYKKEMGIIFENLLNDEVRDKVLGVYNEIKDIGVQGNPDRSLKTAVEIIKNILDNQEAVQQINDIIKNGSV